MPLEPEVLVIPAGDALLDDPPRTIHVNVFAIAVRPLTHAAFVKFARATSHAGSGRAKGPDAHPAEGLSWAAGVAYFRLAQPRDRTRLPVTR